jgi:uncharacterized cupredoxin-like copper-binding protein
MLFAVLAALTVAGCTSSTPEPVVYTIDMTEYAFAPVRIDARVGQQVTLNLVNNGKLAHEIMFGRGVIIENSLPKSFENDMFMEAGVEPVIEGGGEEHEDEMDMEMEEGHGVMVFLGGTGDHATMTFTVTKDMVGQWEIGCFEEKGVHYQAGMKGEFIVTE